MATSLQRQLAALAAPASTLLRPDRKRVSIIFTSEEAAKHDRDTFYRIGLDGLAELVTTCPDLFSPFVHCMLFSEQGKHFERSVEDAQTNKQVDQLIDQFLVTVSPYLMLKSSMKCLEWLVYRFHIETFNVSSLMECILPYYDTKQFVMIAQALQFGGPADPTRVQWEWLIPSITSGTIVRKSVLFGNVNGPFVLWLFQTFRKFVKVHRNHQDNLSTFLSFIVSTIVGVVTKFSRDFSIRREVKAIKGKRTVIDVVLNQIYSVLDEICSSAEYKKVKSNREIFSAAYVMIATIGIAAEENPEIGDTVGLKIRKIFNVLITNRDVVLLEETYLLIEMLVHHIYLDWTMKQPKELKQAINDLSIVSQDWDVSKVTIKLLVANSKEGLIQTPLLFKALAKIQLSPQCRSDILRNCYLAYKDSSLKSAKKLLTRFELEYPVEFSLACEEDSQFAEDLASLKRGKDFILTLNHPEEELRTKAVRKVIQSLAKNVIKKGVSKKPTIKTKKSLMLDNNPIAKSLIGKFEDDSEAVVRALLVSKKLFEIFKPETIINGCITVLKRTKGMKVKRLAIKKLCLAAEKISGDNKLEDKVVGVLVPYLFPRKGSGVNIAMRIMQSPFAQKNKLLKSFKKVGKKSGKTAEEICSLSYEILGKAKDSVVLAENGQYSAVSLSIAFLTVQNEDGLGKLIDAAKQLGLRSTSEFPVTPSKFGESLKPAHARNCVSVELILTSILNMDKLTLRSKLQVIKFVWELCENLKYRGACLQFLKLFQHKISPTEGDQFWFWLKTLIYLTTAESQVKNEFYLLRCLQFFTVYVSKHGIPAGITGKKGANISPSWCLLEVLLSKCIQHESPRVRKLCLAFLEVIRKVPQLSVDWEDLSTRILDYSKEILADGSQAAVLIGKAIVDAKLERVRSEMIKALGSLETHKDIFTGLVNICQHTGSLMSSELDPMIRKLIELNPKSNQLLSLLNCFEITPKSVQLVPKLLEMKECAKIVLKQLNFKLYGKADSKFKKQLFRLMIDSAVTCKNAEVKLSIQRCVRKWDVETAQLAEELKSCVDAERKFAAATARKQMEGMEAFQNWKERAEVILEFIQGMKIQANFKPLLVPLFKILKICITLEEQSPVEYLKQLTLTALTMCCADESEEVADGTFQVELVIDCLRCSRNPQTHHHALILLNYAAKRFHEQVLHGVMSLFTFMGNSILRQDDTYSTQLIQQTVTTIIPALTKSARGGPVERTILSSGIFRVFTSALVDIPVHRRLPVLSSLVETLNPEECLWQLLIIIVDNALNRDRKRANLNADLDLAVDLAWLYGQQTAVTSLTKIYQFFMSIASTLFIKSEVSPQEFISIQKRQQPQDKAVFDFSRKENYRDIQLVVYYTVELMVKICTKFAEADSDTPDKIDYDKILECSLAFSKIVGSHKENKICRLLMQRNMEVIEKINNVLEPEDFVRVITVILSRKDMPIQRKILDMLNTRLIQKADWFGDMTVLLQLVDPLLEVSKQDPDMDEIVTTIQTSFMSLKLIAKHLAFQNPEEFHPVFDLCLDYATHSNHLLCASALLCLGELFCLKSLLLPSLNKVTSAILRAFKSSLKHHQFDDEALHSQENGDVDSANNSRSEAEGSVTTAHLLCISTIACMNKMVEQLGPLMGSKFLRKALILVLSIDTHYAALEASSPRRKVFDQRLRALLKTISVKIPIRNSLIPLKGAFQDLTQKPRAEQAIMGIIKDALQAAGKQDFISILPSLCDAFLEEFLGYRSNIIVEESIDEEVTAVENAVIDCLISGAVLKMSEGTFRPYYHKLFDWAKESTERLITFFRFSSSAAERLKSLFVTFAGNVMNEAVGMLNKGVKLNEGILGFFYHIFSNDREGFVTTDRFNTLVKPLVDMLECDDVLNGDIHLKTLSDCLIQLAVASNDLNRWQYMMDLVSTKASHSQKSVRLHVVAMFEAAAAELGKDFLPVLPAVVPFLAELMNDDEPEVESATQKMLLKLEAIVGEPLQSYFT